MVLKRRSLLLGVPAVLAGLPMLFAQQQGPPDDPSLSHPPFGPPPFDSGGPGLHPNPRVQLKENDKKLKQDADKLLHLAQDLKKEADNTDDTGVLSVSLMNKAQEVEKLAHQIRGLAKSN